MVEIQKHTRDSLKWNLKNALSHDWIPRDRAKTFPLKDFYVELKWTRTVKGAIRNTKTTIGKIHEMFNFKKLGKKRINILVEGVVFSNLLCDRFSKTNRLLLKTIFACLSFF